MAPCRAALLAALAGAAAGSRMGRRRSPFLGAAVLPHGDFALEPELLEGWAPTEAIRKAESLHRGASAAGQYVASLGAQVIVLVTPHGVESPQQITVYGSARLSGNALVGLDVNESFGDGAIGPGTHVSFEARGDPALAERFAEALNAERPGVATVLSGMEVPLRWGEVFPLRSISPSGKLTSATLIVLSLPASRRKESGRLGSEFGRLGLALGRFLEAQDFTSALLISTDLAHTHWGNTSFGANPNAQDFDDACGRWATTLDDSIFAIQESIVVSVKSCGWLGLPLLHGALSATAAGGGWHSALLAKPCAPTYYGMMVATFDRGERTF